MIPWFCLSLLQADLFHWNHSFSIFLAHCGLATAFCVWSQAFKQGYQVQLLWLVPSKTSVLGIWPQLLHHDVLTKNLKTLSVGKVNWKFLEELNFKTRRSLYTFFLQFPYSYLFSFVLEHSRYFLKLLATLIRLLCKKNWRTYIFIFWRRNIISNCCCDRKTQVS